MRFSSKISLSHLHKKTHTMEEKHPTLSRHRGTLTLVLLALTFVMSAAAGPFSTRRTAPKSETPLRVACVGNSITYGYGLTHRDTECYPARLQERLGKGYDVRNFGHSGTTLLRRGHRPYIAQEVYRNALDFRPDIVVIHLGINDTDPRNWPFFRDDFTKDYIALVDSFRAANPKARFFLARMSPISHRHHRFLAGTRDWHKLIQRAIERVAAATGARLIDFYEPLLPHPEMLPDGLHPDKAGAALLADVVYAALTGEHGGLQLPAGFSDNMVIRRHQPFTVSGRADAGAVVLAEFAGQKHKTTADADGRWQVTFAPVAAGTNYNLSVSSGRQTLRLRNIAAGEVWLCSGQSNMAFPLRNAVGAERALAAADDADLRLLNLLPRWDTDNSEWDSTALDSVNRLLYLRNDGWQTATRENVGNVSAVAYHFARMLRDSLKVPVGLIVNAVGGSTTESWIDRRTLEDEFPELLNDRFGHNVMVMPWVVERMRKNIARATDKLQRHPYQPTYLFDAGIRPLKGCSVDGVLWYQGESNAENMEIHERLFPLLLRSWRTYLGEPDLPFYTVQLSSINRPSWPWFRESQRRMAEALKGVYMAVSSDVGDSLDVHPRHKQPIGERLARLVLHHERGFAHLTPCGPSAPRATLHKGAEVEVSFQWSRGLTTSDGQAVRTFEVAGADEVFHPAATTLHADRVRLHCPEVEHPVWVRYGWQPFTRANLVNAEGLPASTFRIAVEGAKP